MMLRKLMVAGAVAAALTATSQPATARTDFYLNFGPPPPPTYVVVPAPRHGFFWVPGHWAWRGHRHVWVEGHWVRERAGYSYEPARWVEINGRWYFREGGWHRRR